MMTKDKLTRLKGNERLGQNRDSEYLGAEDIDDSVEPVLTIEAIWNGICTTQKGKENHDVISFVEQRAAGIFGNVRPLIVNATNRKTLRKLFGSPSADALAGQKIQLYIDHKVRDPQDGGFTDGIRIRPHKPRVQRVSPVPNCTDCGCEIVPAMGKDARWLAAYTVKNYGVPLCAACAQKRKSATVSTDVENEPPAEPAEPVETAEESEVL